jgi:heparinase II/III-like protein
VAESALARAGAYVDAVRALEPRQLAHRPRRLVSPRLLAAGLRNADAPSWRPLAAGAGVDSAPQSGPTPPAHQAGVFEAVGISRAAGAADLWSSRDRSDLLFAFTVHSFDELPRYLAGERGREGDAFWERALGDWLERCSAPAMPGWHPYPLARRIVAWCGALSAGGWDPKLERALQRSATRQVRYLRRCVEHDVGGNHVLEEAVALAIGGTCLGDRQAAEQGRRLLTRELAAQVLDDGGHLERSPSYHRRALDRLRDARRALERAGQPLPELDHACGAMTAWLRAIAGPQGGVPLLNDGWDGPPVDPAADDLGNLAATGYFVLRHGGDQAVLDVGPLCPPHLPPHAHADALSFVMWADATPLVIDPGSGAYHGDARGWSRATASHNTVEVDGEDQCVFLGDFRAARLPQVRCERLERRNDAVIVAARHDGYGRLPDPVEHRRLFCWLPGDGLVVVDAVRADQSHGTRSRLHLAPDADDAPVSIRPLFGAGSERGTGRVAPYLGTLSTCAVLEQRGDTAQRPVQGWSLLRSEADVRQEGDEVVVDRPGRAPVRFMLG